MKPHADHAYRILELLQRHASAPGGSKDAVDTNRSVQAAVQALRKSDEIRRPVDREGARRRRRSR